MLSLEVHNSGQRRVSGQCSAVVVLLLYTRAGLYLEVVQVRESERLARDLRVVNTLLSLPCQIYFIEFLYD